MARNHARILCRIWQDKDFKARSMAAQWLYMTLLSQPTISNAGVLPFTPGAWARLADDVDSETVARAVAELVDQRFLVVDEDTAEVLVRSFMRNDGVSDNGKVFLNALKVARQVQSDRLKEVLAMELRRVGTDSAVQSADELSPLASSTALSPVQDMSDTFSGSPIEKKMMGDRKISDAPEKSCGVGIGVGEGGMLVLVETTVSSNEDVRPQAAPTRKSIDQDFDRFWAAYPKHESKTGAKTKFASLVKRGAVTAEVLISAAQRYASWCVRTERNRQHIKQPTTWLNNGCWEDELDGSSSAAAVDDPTNWLRDQWHEAAVTEICRRTGLRYEQPNLPLGLSQRDEIDEFHRQHRRDWIDENRARILANLESAA